VLSRAIEADVSALSAAVDDAVAEVLARPNSTPAIAKRLAPGRPGAV